MDIAAAKRRPMLTDSGPGVCRNCYRVFEKRATSDGLKVEPCKIDNKCVITRETRIQCLNCFMAKCFSLGLSLGKFNSMESLPNSIDSKKQETTAPESRPKRQVTVPEVVSKRPSRKSVEKRTTSPDKLKVTKVVEKVKPKVAPNQSTKPKAKRGRPPKNPIKVVKSPSSAPKSPKPPKKEKCPICKTVLLPGSSSIEFGFAACRQCARFFKRKYESNEWTIPKCIDGLKKCKITFEDRTKCKFCLMKTCFKVGFKYDDFDKMKKLQVESNDLNQNLKVKLIDAEVKALVPFEPRKRKAEVLEQPVAKFTKTECEVCGAESKGVRNGVHACNPCGGFFWKVSKARKAVRCKANQNCNVGLSKCPYCRLKRCLIAGMNVIGSREALEYTDEEIEQILDGNYDIEKDDSEEMLALEETEYNKISKTPAKQSSVRKPQPTVLALEYKKGNCTICSRDNAHYFQAFFVCQKCVNFFQNSITNKNMYFCQKASCSTLKTAKCCKYCRLKKCLELGMNNNEQPDANNWSISEPVEYTTDEIQDILQGEAALDQLALEFVSDLPALGWHAESKNETSLVAENLEECSIEVLDTKQQIPSLTTDSVLDTIQSEDVDFRDRLEKISGLAEREGLYKCPDCDDEFNDSANLFLHLKKLHDENNPQYSDVEPIPISSDDDNSIVLDEAYIDGLF